MGRDLKCTQIFSVCFSSMHENWAEETKIINKKWKKTKNEDEKTKTKKN